ncbi:MAG: sulfite exporter TauE/SafE family protein [Actinomycetes bacterium]
MLTSITPLGERGRASRYGVTVVAYVLGSVVGGTALGVLAGGLGRALPVERPAMADAALTVVAVVAVLAAAVELGRLPQPATWHRQVDEDWLHRYRGWVYGLGYGLQLGFGLVTIVTSPVLYVAVLLTVLTSSPVYGALVGASFGLVRARPVLTLRRVQTSAQLAAAARRTESLAPTARRLVTATLIGVALTAGAVVVSGGTA